MTEITYSTALRQALADSMHADPSVMLLGEDIGVYGGAFGVTRGLLDTFGSQRVVDTPISEGGFTGLAVGAALMGSRPVVEIMFMDFATLTVDQLVNQAAKIRYVHGNQATCPLVVRMVGGGGRGYGPTHSQNLEAWFMHTPGLKVVAPATVADAYGMLCAAIRDDNPVVFFEHKRLYATKATLDIHAVTPRLNGANRLRTGEDITLVAYSYMTHEALRAADALAGEGVHADVIDLRSLAPLDTKAVAESVADTGRVVVCAEDNRTGSVAAEIMASVMENAFEYLDAPPLRLTAPDAPIPASPPLEQAALPNADTIVNASRQVMTY